MGDGPDCSHRVSPHGDDPLTTVKSSMMKQVVQVGHTDNSAFSTDARTREEFLMVYHDPYGGVWRTDGIVASTSDIIAASRVQDALRALPNEVLEGVSVKARTSSTVSLCTRFYDGVQHLVEVDINKRGAGSFPVSGGITGGAYSVAEM